MAKLREAATLDLTGSRVRVRLINEGQGSSGFYASQILESDGPTAFPKGTFLFYNHVKPGERDIRDAFGVLAEDAKFDKETAALWGDADIFEEHQTRVKQLAPHVGLSIEAAGDVDDDGNVIEIAQDPFNAIAMVHRAGRGGKIAAILESANISDNEPNGKREDAGMTPEEIESLAEALAAKVTAAIQTLAEALTPAPKVEEEENKGPDPLAVAEALVAVPEVARKRVLEAIGAGAELDAAIAAEKAYIEEIQKDESVENGRLGESGNIDPKPMTVKGW